MRAEVLSEADTLSQFILMNYYGKGCFCLLFVFNLTLTSKPRYFLYAVHLNEELNILKEFIFYVI